MSKNVTIYTGTFTKANGESRTMNFIRSVDLPSEMQGDNPKHLTEGRTTEVVYDADKKGFRNFNWGTVQGSVSKKQSTFEF